MSGSEEEEEAGSSGTPTSAQPAAQTSARVDAADRIERRSLAEAGREVAALAAAGLGAAVGSLAADALGLRGADRRFVAVCLGMGAPLLAARLTRPGASRLARGVWALAAPLWLTALLWPRSAAAVTSLSGAVLTLGLGAVLVGTHRAWRAAPRRGLRPPLALLVLAPLLLAWSAAFVVLFNTQLIIAPVRLAHLDPTLDPGERPLTLRTEDGYRLAGTYTPGRPGAPGIVLTHGVADGRERLRPWARALARRGYHSLRFDVRAHGLSEGAVCTYGQREDADVRAAVDALRRTDGVDEGRIGVVGASMGGGIVLAAAPTLRERGVRSLILLAPASDYAPLVRQRVELLGPAATLVLDAAAPLARAMGQVPMPRWAPAAASRSSRLPMLVMHSRADGAIPVRLSRRLAADRPEVELHLLGGVGHEATPAAVVGDPRHWRVALGFLERHL